MKQLVKNKKRYTYIIAFVCLILGISLTPALAEGGWVYRSDPNYICINIINCFAPPKTCYELHCTDDHTCSGEFLPSTTVCRPKAAADLCDVEERCLGGPGPDSMLCPTDQVVPAGTQCSPGDPSHCLENAFCDGTSPSCPSRPPIKDCIGEDGCCPETWNANPNSCNKDNDSDCRCPLDFDWNDTSTVVALPNPVSCGQDSDCASYPHNPCQVTKCKNNFCVAETIPATADNPYPCSSNESCDTQTGKVCGIFGIDPPCKCGVRQCVCALTSASCPDCYQLNATTCKCEPMDKEGAACASDGNACTDDVCQWSDAEHSSLVCAHPNAANGSGTTECADNSLTEINTCTNTPDDGNPRTLDYATGFTSSCQNGSCSTGNRGQLTHTCNVDLCHAECVTTDPTHACVAADPTNYDPGSCQADCTCPPPTLKPDKCLIGGAHYDNGDQNPANPCQVCKPVAGNPASQTNWTQVTKNATCGFGPCRRIVDECSSGSYAACTQDDSKKRDEICDEVDNDCDGFTNEGFPDSDNDAVFPEGTIVDGENWSGRRKHYPDSYNTGGNLTLGFYNVMWQDALPSADGCLAIQFCIAATSERLWGDPEYNHDRITGKPLADEDMPNQSCNKLECKVGQTCDNIGRCLGGSPMDCGPAPDTCHDWSCQEVEGIGCPNVNQAPLVGNGCYFDKDENGQSECVALHEHPSIASINHQCRECNPGGDGGTGGWSDLAGSCDDGNACTETDTCQAGACVGANLVTCTALDQCHVAGECIPSTGDCTNPEKQNGTSCNDGSACTRTDTCQTGVCTGGDPVVCTASDQCHDVGTCDPISGTCNNPFSPSGADCDDGVGCTENDVCDGSGSCAGTRRVCSPTDACHLAGVCDEASGQCSNPDKLDFYTGPDEDCRMRQCNSTSGWIWVNANEGGSCKYNKYCPSLNTYCSAGACVCGPEVVCTGEDCVTQRLPIGQIMAGDREMTVILNMGTLINIEQPPIDSDGDKPVEDIPEAQGKKITLPVNDCFVTPITFTSNKSKELITGICSKNNWGICPFAEQEQKVRVICTSYKDATTASVSVSAGATTYGFQTGGSLLLNFNDPDAMPYKRVEPIEKIGKSVRLWPLGDTGVALPPLADEAPFAKGLQASLSSAVAMDAVVPNMPKVVSGNTEVYNNMIQIRRYPIEGGHNFTISSSGDIEISSSVNPDLVGVSQNVTDIIITINTDCSSWAGVEGYERTCPNIEDQKLDMAAVEAEVNARIKSGEKVASKDFYGLKSFEPYRNNQFVLVDTETGRTHYFATLMIEPQYMGEGGAGCSKGCSVTSVAKMGNILPGLIIFAMGIGGLVARRAGKRFLNDKHQIR